MDYGIRRLSGGTADLASAMLGAAGVSDSAAADELAKLQTGRYRAAKAREADAAAAIEEDRRTALQGLEGALGPIMAGLALDPSNSGQFATFLRAGGGNASQLSSGLTNLAEGGRQTRAVDTYKAGNPELANIMLAASGRTPYQPYAQNAQGSVLNQATGAVDQTSPIAQGSLGAIAALEAERGAHAGLYGAQQETEGYRPDLIKAQTSEANAGALRDLTAAAGGADASPQRQRQLELEAQGVPPHLARAAAYGQLTYRQDPTGLAWELVDPLTQTVVARRDMKGGVQWNPAYYGAGAGAAPGGMAGTSPEDPLGLRGPMGP